MLVYKEVTAYQKVAYVGNFKFEMNIKTDTTGFTSKHFFCSSSIFPELRTNFILVNEYP